MQHGGTVRIEHTLGMAGGARGVAQRRGGVLVETRPRVAVALRLDEFLVAQQPGQIELGHVRAIGQHHVVLHRFQLRREFLHQRAEAQVEKQHLVLGVIDDVADLLGRKPRVDRVQHHARAGHAVVELQMAPGVPRQGGDGRVAAELQRGERVGDLARPPGHAGPVGAMHRPLHAAADDLDPRMERFGMLDQRGDQQRPVLHQAKHGRAPVSARDEGMRFIRRRKGSRARQCLRSRSAPRRRHAARPAGASPPPRRRAYR